MNIVIDEFNNNAGFSAFGNATIYPENELPDYIAGADNIKSTLFEFLENGDYVEKTGLNIDVTNYNYIICHFYSSRNHYAGARKMDSADFVYSVEFNDIELPYYFPVYNSLAPVVFQIPEMTAVTKIKINYLGNKTDRLFCSHCLAVQDELPLDIFVSTKDLIEKEIASIFNDGVLLGTVTTAPGDTEVSLSNINWQNLKHIDRYAVIKIDDTINSEIHTLANNDERYFKFEKDNDGERIINNFVDANIYLIVPVRYGVKQVEYNTPSISITGFNPESVLRGSKAEQIITTGQGNTSAYTRQNDQIQQHRIQVYCVDRKESNIMAIMSQIIRNVIAREILWINGWKFDIYYDGRPEFIEWAESDNPITGLMYTIILEVKEEIWQNQKLPETLTKNLSVQIQNS